MPNDYKVGYRKPPKHTQFKKGKSGNPKGRPKGSKNMRTILNDILDSKVTIIKNGRTRKVPFKEAFTHSMAAKALNGTMRDQVVFLKAANDYAPEALNGDEVTTSIAVRFVNPSDGKPESSEESNKSVENLESDPKASSPEEKPDPDSDDIDSWPD